MKIRRPAKAKAARPAKAAKTKKPHLSLKGALGRSERVKDLVEECAQELSTVNGVLQEELVTSDAAPQLEGALEQSADVEGKVQVASKELEVVNRALKEEVKERHALEDDLAATKQQTEAARHAALHDALTGLANRALFDDRLKHGLAQAQRHGWTLAVMFLDLDNFKTINDSYGHEVGDTVLKTIAARLQEHTRKDDTVSRHGGDEFLYLLMEVGGEGAIVSIADKIIKMIQEPCEVNGQDVTSLSVKASIGISMFPRHGSTPAALVMNADNAMYRAKRENSGYAFAP